MTASSPTSSPATLVLSGLDEVRSWAADFYRDLHAHPELSHQEQATSAKVIQRLSNSGIEVHAGIGDTGVVGLVRNGEGPTVLLRADMDALPIAEGTGLEYASNTTAIDETGNEVPVMHACGHDMHVTWLLGAAHLLSAARGNWSGTLVVIFQPAEETGDGARSMVKDGLTGLIPKPDVALAQHLLPFSAGLVGTRSGPILSGADSIRITLHGRGAHGSVPQASVDPVVLAAMVVVRLQTIVAREMQPGEPVVVTVGRLQAGTKSNVIPDHATIEVNVRTYKEQTRTSVLRIIRRIVDAECAASGSPQPADYELFGRFPITNNDDKSNAVVTAAFTSFFGERTQALPMQTASEDFSDIPDAFGTPYCYWGVGGIDFDTYRKAEKEDRVSEDIPVNHSARFAPVLQPTLDTGIEAMVVATLAWLGQPNTRNQ